MDIFFMFNDSFNVNLILYSPRKTAQGRAKSTYIKRRRTPPRRGSKPRIRKRFGKEPLAPVPTKTVDKRRNRIDGIEEDKQREKVLMSVAIRSLLAKHGVERDIVSIASTVVMRRLFVLFACQLDRKPAITRRTVGMMMMRNDHAQQHYHTGKQHDILIHLLSHRLFLIAGQK